MKFIIFFLIILSIQQDAMSQVNGVITGGWNIGSVYNHRFKSVSSNYLLGLGVVVPATNFISINGGIRYSRKGTGSEKNKVILNYLDFISDIQIFLIKPENNKIFIQGGFYGGALLWDHYKTDSLEIFHNEKINNYDIGFTFGIGDYIYKDSEDPKVLSVKYYQSIYNLNKFSEPVLKNVGVEVSLSLMF